MLQLLVLIKRLASSLYFDPTAVCSEVDKLSLFSKHNFKSIKSSGRNLTFVCSAVSKKTFCGKSCESSEEETQSECRSGPRKESNDRRTKFQAGPKSNSKRTKSKRTNEKACNFRLKFKYDPLSRTYSLAQNSVTTHNHFPEQCESVEVSTFKNILKTFSFSSLLQPIKQ
jgi:hypothetical protein